MANHDHLTNLPNRKFLAQNVKNIFNRVNKNKIAVLFIDMDNFKKINDRYGHEIGDQVLKEVADRLKDTLRKNDIISRIGGDEFLVLVQNIGTNKEIRQVKNKIMAIFETPLRVNNLDIKINFSIGASIYPDDGNDIEQLIKKADNTMYQAKKAVTF